MGRARAQGTRRRTGAPVIWVIALMCVLPEIVFLGVSVGVWGDPLWRGQAYQYGAFWPGLLSDWKANYAYQPLSMFLTYAFLHSGPWHMVLNTVTLFSLGDALVERIGQGRFLLLYLLSALGGASGFAAMAPAASPMVGASGALFGLAGALILDLWWETRKLRVLFVPVLGLIALNVAMYWAMDGLLAWQTHLGGFLAGALAMAVVAPPAR